MKKILLILLAISATEVNAASSDLISAAICLGYKNAEFQAVNLLKDNNPEKVKWINKLENQTQFLYKKFQKELEADEKNGNKILGPYIDKPMNSYTELINKQGKCKNLSDREKIKECELSLTNNWLNEIKKACEVPLANFK